MIERRGSLPEVLADIDAGRLRGITRAIVSRGWWDALPSDVRTGLQRSCLERRVELFADDRVSPHFVEAVGDSDAPLASERHV
jgi:hypothetical protein